MSHDPPCPPKNDNNTVGRERNLPRHQWQLLHSGRKRRRRRHYLVVPQTEEDLANLEDAYCDYDGQGTHPSERNASLTYDTFASSSQQIRRRPLPPTQNFISLVHDATDTRTNKKANSNANANANATSGNPTAGPSLLMKAFYESVGMQDHLTVADTSKDIDTADSQKETRQATEEIDDPSLSTMKIGHHKRYLKLTKNSQQQQHQTPKHKFLQQKELKKMRQMIVQEQASYRLALDKFHDRHKARYLIGFESGSPDGITGPNATATANQFSRWACSQAHLINREWKKALAMDRDQGSSDGIARNSSDLKEGRDFPRPVPKYYGNVRQTLGLHPRAHRTLLDVQDLTCSVVHQSPTVSRPSSSSSSAPPTLSPTLAEFSHSHNTLTSDDNARQEIPPPTTESAPTVQLLREDPKALELAARYSASIVTTSETLETLLRLPGDYSSSWMVLCTNTAIPTSKSKSKSSSTPSSLHSVYILDLPIGQAFSSPRACLETGLQEGIYQLFQQGQPNTHNQPMTSTHAEKNAGKRDDTSDASDIGTDSPPRPTTQFFYSLWTLPAKKVGGDAFRKPVRVIIRTLVRLKDSVSKVPVRMRSRVEYFHSPVNASGRSHREIPNSYEKSLWILDQVLFGHQAFCLQYRIDPTTCKILGWDTTSIAHAFAESSSDGGPRKSSDSKTDGIGPLDHWRALIQLLRSIPAIDSPDTILCLPGLIGERKTLVNDSNKEAGSMEENIGHLGEESNNQETQHQVCFDPFSVSVHASCEDVSISISKRTQDETQLQPTPACSTATICLDSGLLDRAGSVRLGHKALLDCRRDWEWDRPDQVPNTFPVAESIE